MGGGLSQEQLSSVEQWLEQKINEGYSLAALSQYLSNYGYSKQHVFEVLSYHHNLVKNREGHAAAQDMLSEEKDDSESLNKVIPKDVAPKVPTEFFTRLYVLLKTPSLFFSHLYLSKKLKGLRMLSFAAIISMGIGSIFWFLFYVFNAFLFIPDVLKNYLDISFTSQTFLLFTLVFALLQPAFYIFVHKSNQKITFIQSLSATIYAYVPFVLLAFLPLFNIIGLISSLQLLFVSMRKSLRANERTIFYAGTMYAIAITLIALAMSLIVATVPQVDNPSCTVFPTGQCSVTQTGWNELHIEGISNAGVIIYDENDLVVCQYDESMRIMCDNILLPGAYYFASPTTTGAFTLA